MKKACNSLRVNKKMISAIAILLIVFLCVGVVFAAVSYISAKGRIDLVSIKLNATSEFSYTEEKNDLAFTQPGEQKQIQIQTVNADTPSVLRCSYSFSLSADSDGKLPQAIFVYFNGDYIGTLQELTDGAQKVTGSYVGAVNGTATDTFTLELHLGADGSLYDGKNLSLITSAYTETADYADNLFVSTTAELNRAIDDINSGLLDSKIILLSDVSYGNINVITQPCTVDLNGHTLSGAAVLDGEKACLNVIGKGGNTATYTLTQYDQTAVTPLLLSAAQTALKEGVNGGTQTDLFGHLKFYAPEVTVSGNATYANGILTAASVTRSAVETLTFGTNAVEFIIFDRAESLAEKYLKNIPSDGAKIVTSDLYLPTTIRGEGASIEWTSSDESVMDHTGRITASQADKAPVALYATIRVNNAVYTEKFSFLVSAHTNEINFYKLVATVSPVIVYEVGNVTNGTGLYQLPIVDKTSDYDYRKSYETPENSVQTGDAALKYKWTAYPDIFLSDLSYSLLTKDDTEIYSYIGMKDSCVYLKQDTLNTYAEISVRGTFETGETYESRVRIIIATGTDTEVLEEAFNHAQENLQSIDILKNILASRVKNGMAEEKGDFTLLASYTAQNGNTYQISYTESNDIITEIVKTDDTYTVKIDPTKFSDTETQAAITVTVTWGETSRSKTMYFSVPAAVHAADLGNASIFNSVKYQVYQQLPDAEKGGNGGFSTDATTITNTTPDYILLRDILGDTTYKADGYYSSDGDYLYDGAEKYDGCKELWFNTAANAADYTDTYARDLAALVNWATGRGTGAAKNTVIDTTALGTYGDTLSNGKEYLDDSEVTVIKTYYQSVTKITDEQWNALWSQVAEQAPGYVIFNSAQLNATVSSIVSGSANDYFKYIETLRWASNESRNTEGGKVLDDAINNLGTVGNRDWLPVPATYTNSTISVTETISVFGGNQSGAGTRTVTYTYAFSSDNGIRWYSSPSRSYNSSYTDSVSKYNVKNYKLTCSDVSVQEMYSSYNSYLADLTDYIAPSEFEAMAAYWLNLDTSYSKGRQFINAFYECALIPTYFTTEGVQTLLSSLYSDAKITINGNFKTAAVSTESYTELTPSGKVEYVPAVVNLEDLSIGISYFGGLTSLYICGSGVLPAFLSEYGLNSALSRMVSSVKDLQTLVMQHVADGYVPFDLDNVKKLSFLTQIDVSDNHGVTNLSALVNTNSGKYTYVDFSRVNVSREFQEYALTNLHRDVDYVYYSETESETRQLYSGAKAANAALTYLDELEQIIAEKMFATTEVTVTDGETASTVYWRIESGNKITLVSSAGTAVTIGSTSEMQRKISPYYYCDSNFTYAGINFQKGYVYRFSYADDGGVTSVTEIATEVESVQNVNNAADAYTVSDSVLESGKTLISSGNTTEESNTTKETNIIKEQSYTLPYDSYTITFTCYQFYRTYSGWFRTYYYHLYDNGNTLASTTTQNTSSTTSQNGALFCFLTGTEYSLVTGQTKLTTDIEVGGTTTGEKLYIYFPETGRFLGVNGTETALQTFEYAATANIVPFRVQSGYTISYLSSSSSYYYITLATKNNGSTLSFSTSMTNSNLSRSDGGTKQEVINYYLSITVDGTTEYKATSFGYEIIETVDSTVTTQTQTTDVYRYTSPTYLYWDSSAEAVYRVVYTYEYGGSRNRQKTDTTTTYSYRIWYVDENGTEQDITASVTTSVTDGTNTILVSELLKGYTDSSVTGTWSDDWSTELTSSWVKQTPVIQEYISYVAAATQSNIVAQTGMVGAYVRYTGTSGYDSYYNQSTTASSSAVDYQNGSIYRMTVSGGSLAWERSGTGTYSQPTGDTMDNILDMANTNFNNSQYGNYYGMYYAYNGSTITTTNGNTYVQYGVYRLMPNAGNTAFEFVYVQQYERKDIDTVTLEIAGRTEEENKAAVGKIYYITAAARTYAVGFYILDYNETSGSYYLKSFCDADIICDATNYSVLQNYRLLSVSRKNQENNYGGTGNTLQVTITAFVRIDGVEYVRRYSVDIVG